MEEDRKRKQTNTHKLARISQPGKTDITLAVEHVQNKGAPVR